MRARRGVVLGTGGFEWDPRLVEAYLRGPMHGPVSPPNNTGDGLRMAMAHGADLANMGEAWWVPIIQIPGDTIDGHQRSRSVRLERTRPRSIIVNRAGKRFLNEAGEYNSMAGPFHHLDPRFGYVNDPGVDRVRLAAPQEVRLPRRRTRRRGARLVLQVGRSRRTGREDRHRPPTGWPARSTRGTATSHDEADPDFGRGASAYDGYWGDTAAATPALQTLGPIDTAPYFAVPVTVGAMGTKGGPRTDADGRVLHVSGEPIPGLYAAGNAMAGVTGKAYGGAGGTLGPAMVFGYRAGLGAHVVTDAFR